MAGIEESYKPPSAIGAESQNQETMRPIDLSEAREFVSGLVLEAGEILKGYRTSGDFRIEAKGEHDIFTQADTEVEQLLKNKLLERYPGTTFLGEETAPEQYSDLRKEKNLWIVDPVDGTINFARGNPHFAISVALVSDGKPILGITHLPVFGETYSAQEDKEGTYMNGHRVEVSKVADINGAVLESDSAIGKFGDTLKILEKLSGVNRIQLMGSAVAVMSYVARGTVDAYVHPHLKPWDVAAASLLIEKAGGKVTTANGEEWNVFERTILATNGVLHERILKLMRAEKSAS